MNNNLFALVSKDLIERKRIEFMYKENPDNPTDSGWRFFSGYETQEYLDSVDNIVIYSLSEVINNIDSSIEPYLSSEPKVAYEREENSNQFVIIDDFVFGDDLE